MTDRFVDFTAGLNGDGTSPTPASVPGGVGARNRLAPTDFGSGMSVWVRRAGSYVIPGPVIFNGANITFIGWPQGGDADYAGRPAAAISAGWDADSNTWAQVTSSDVLKTLAITNGTAWRRFSFTHTLAAPSTSGTFLTIQDCNTEFTNCLFQTQQTSGSGKVDACAVKGSSAPTNCKAAFNTCTFKSTIGKALISQFNDASFFSCTFTAVSTGTMVLVSVQGGDQQAFEDCTFGISGTCTKPTLLEVVPIGSDRMSHYFLACSFDDHLSTQWHKTLDVGGAASFHDCTFNGIKVAVRDPWNKGNPSTPTQWTPGVFPIHFQQMTFQSSPLPPSPDAYISSYPDFTGLLFIVENFDPTDCDLVACNVTMPMPGSSHADFVGQVNYPIGSWFGRYRFRNVNTGMPFSRADLTISGGRTIRNFIGLLPFPGVEALDDVGGSLQWAKYNCFGQVSPTAPTGFEQYFLPVTWIPNGESTIRRCPLRLDEGAVHIFLGAGTHTLTAAFTVPSSIENVQWALEVSYLDQASGAHRATKTSGLNSYWDPAHNPTSGPAAVTITMLQSGWVELRFFYQDEGVGAKVTPMVVVT